MTRPTIAYRVAVSHAAAPYKGVHAFGVVTEGNHPSLYHATSPAFGRGPVMPSPESAIVALVRDHSGLVESIEWGEPLPSFV